ncbi:hypothetical protein D0N87_33815, partial [Pseudomonas sp. ATCC 13867]
MDAAWASRVQLEDWELGGRDRSIPPHTELSGNDRHCCPSIRSQAIDYRGGPGARTLDQGFGGAMTV